MNELYKDINKQDRFFFIINTCLVLFWVALGCVLHFVLKEDIFISFIFLCGLLFFSDYMHRIQLKPIAFRIGESVGRMRLIKELDNKYDIKPKVKK